MNAIALVAMGVDAGLVSTAFMTVLQAMFWREWGLTGVLEWHENQMIWSRLSGGDAHVFSAFGVFFLHLINGGLAAAPFALLVTSLPGLSLVPLPVTGIVYGILLWLLTLFAIHRPITGISLTSHPQGVLPVAASLFGHLVYGVVISLFVAPVVW